MHILRFFLAVILMAGPYAVGSDFDAVARSIRTVTGSQIVHYKDGPSPTNFSVQTIAALVPNGSTYTVYPGSGTSHGTFAIPNVPAGFYWLQLGAIYLWTSNTVVDAGYFVDARNAVRADQNTKLSFDITNLNPWNSTDFLEMACPNDLTVLALFPSPGQTTFAATVPYFGLLSEAAKGDQCYVEQLITQSVGGYPFDALGGYFAPPKFTQPQGSDTPINGALQILQQTSKFEANINGADLMAQAMATNPNAVFGGMTLSCYAHPGSIAKGFTATPGLVSYPFSGFSRPPIVTNADLGPIFYANPYPKSGWPLLVSYQYNAFTNYMAPGATNPLSFNTLAYGFSPQLPTSTNPVKPLVGVVSNPTINGKDFFQSQNSGGSTPLLTWSSPKVGTANHYSVLVFRLSNNGGNTVSTFLAEFSTQQTSLRIPAGLLTIGSGYVFLVRPVHVPGLNFAKTPFQLGPSFAITDVISGMLQP